MRRESKCETERERGKRLESRWIREFDIRRKRTKTTKSGGREVEEEEQLSNEEEQEES